MQELIDYFRTVNPAAFHDNLGYYGDSGSPFARSIRNGACRGLCTRVNGDEAARAHLLKNHGTTEDILAVIETLLSYGYSLPETALPDGRILRVAHYAKPATSGEVSLIFELDSGQAGSEYYEIPGWYEPTSGITLGMGPIRKVTVHLHGT